MQRRFQLCLPVLQQPLLATNPVASASVPVWQHEDFDDFGEEALAGTSGHLAQPFPPPPPKGKTTASTFYEHAYDMETLEPDAGPSPPPFHAVNHPSAPPHDEGSPSVLGLELRATAGPTRNRRTGVSIPAARQAAIFRTSFPRHVLPHCSVFAFLVASHSRRVLVCSISCNVLFAVCSWMNRLSNLLWTTWWPRYGLQDSPGIVRDNRSGEVLGRCRPLGRGLGKTQACRARSWKRQARSWDDMASTSPYGDI
jgi:hypothetical protein